MQECNIFQVQSYSIHDGPGIRTTVFVKGCPLHCLWCHNPESQNRCPELMWFEEKCAGCGRCATVCEAQAIQMKGKRPLTDRIKCIACGNCEKSCPTEARRVVGEEKTVEDIMKIIQRDAMFYPLSNGGVTVSGGEPLYMPSFTGELLKTCKERGYHTAVETSGYASYQTVESVMQYTDLVFYDLKALDRILHRRLTGVDNERILKNAEFIKHVLGKEMVVRIPLVEECNATVENIRQTGSFIAGRLGKDVKVQLLLYHNLGTDKERQLGREGITEYTRPSEEKLKRFCEIITDYGLNVQIGGSM